MRIKPISLSLSLLVLALCCFVSFPATGAAKAADDGVSWAAAIGPNEAPPMPSQVFIVYYEVLRDGSVINAAPLMLHEYGAHSSFASYDQKVSEDGFFTMKFDALAWGSLAEHYGDGLPEWSGPAEHSAHAVASHFRLGDICLDVYAPGSQTVRASAWRVDTAGKTPDELEALRENPGLGLDADANGIPDGPGEYLGTMTWAINSPDLGYIKDIEVSAEELLKMQFGVGP